MKCDELKEDYCYDAADDKNKAVYLKSDVDEAIAELKDELKNACLERDDNQVAIDEYAKENEELNAENERLLRIPHTDNSAVIELLSKELRATKRALWLARAERAANRARIFYFCDLETKLDIDGFSYDPKKKKGCKKMAARLWRIIWLKVERLCRHKAEEYK